jgi:protein gp37
MDKSKHMSKTKIDWTDAVWNPVTGCTPVSPGCANCYAARMAKRLQAMGVAKYKDGFKVTVHNNMNEIDKPNGWVKPRRVFVNSMSDLFHADVPDVFIANLFFIMSFVSNQHQYQVLTKRSKRLLALDAQLSWAANIWMGVSVENADYMHRIDHLRQTGAKVKFLSLEPLLGPLPNLDLTGIDWVIVGGETGPGARVMLPKWATEIRDRCQEAAVPFFFKSASGGTKLLEGRTWNEMPRL